MRLNIRLLAERYDIPLNYIYSYLIEKYEDFEPNPSFVLQYKDSTCIVNEYNEKMPIELKKSIKLIAFENNVDLGCLVELLNYHKKTTTNKNDAIPDVILKNHIAIVRQFKGAKRFEIENQKLLDFLNKFPFSNLVGKINLLKITENEYKFICHKLKYNAGKVNLNHNELSFVFSKIIFFKKLFQEAIKDISKYEKILYNKQNIPKLNSIERLDDKLLLHRLNGYYDTDIKPAENVTSILGVYDLIEDIETEESYFYLNMFYEIYLTFQNGNGNLIELVERLTFSEFVNFPNSIIFIFKDKKELRKKIQACNDALPEKYAALAKKLKIPSIKYIPLSNDLIAEKLNL